MLYHVERQYDSRLLREVAVIPLIGCLVAQTFRTIVVQSNLNVVIPRSGMTQSQVRSKLLLMILLPDVVYTRMYTDKCVTSHQTKY